MRTFAIVNQKGGCGKTTTAINLSAVFAHRGLRTLLVDMDPQSHCATGLGVPERRIEMSVGDALLKADSDRFDPSSAVWEVGGNLDLLPSTMRLAGLEAPGGGLHELPDRDRRLACLVARFADRYDRCLIDCPPTIGLLTFNALRASREALIPVETGFFALRGAEKQWRTIRQLIERIGRPIACHLFPALHRPESSLSMDVLEALRRQFAGQVIPVIVHEDEVVREAASFGQPVIEYAPDSRSRADFEKLADWLEDHPPQPGVQIEVMHGAAGETALHRRGPETGPGEAGVEPPVVAGRAAELARRVRSLQSRLDDQDDRVVIETPRPDSAPIDSDASPAAVADDPALIGPRPLPSVTESPAPPRETRAATYGAALTLGGVRFAQPGDGRHSVCVAGDFNNWSATSTPLPFDERIGAHEVLVEIPPGRYRYRLVVDGSWKADPFNVHKQVNEYGELNSVLVVPHARDTP